MTSLSALSHVLQAGLQPTTVTLTDWQILTHMHNQMSKALIGTSSEAISCVVHFHVALGNVLLFCGFHLYGIKSTLKTSHSVANPFYWKQCWPFEMTHFCGKAGSFRSLPLEGSLVPQTSCSQTVESCKYRTLHCYS